jgi:23S rRNA G2069 N7-methylase RlmK/C1962 C5-methylase RlmI
VHEYGVKFKVNLKDYLDTGLFLDHRETRKMVAGLAKGKRLLNLFAYTCSFSVQAAAAGARFTKSVDMSNTYTEWGKENFILNGLSLKTNEIVRADCLKFLDYEIGEYDIIVIDPPTISRSKKMEQMFDIQLDYVSLIMKSLKLLAPGGVIFFSTNSRKFKFEESLFTGCIVRDMTEKTLPIDFHNKKIHQCWKISTR